MSFKKSRHLTILVGFPTATSPQKCNLSVEADLAEYIIMIKYAILPLNTPQNVVRLFDSIRGKVINVFMDEYTRLTGTTYDEVDPWIVPIAARKLSADGVSEEEKHLLLKEIRLRLRVKDKQVSIDHPYHEEI